MVDDSSPCAPSLKVAYRTYATLLVPARLISPTATGTVTEARLSLTLRTPPLEPETTRSSTDVPGGPLIRAVATSAGTPASERPSTAVIRSPSLIRARWAGVPGRTVATRSPRLTPVTVRPTPEKRPEVADSNSC